MQNSLFVNLPNFAGKNSVTTRFKSALRLQSDIEKAVASDRLNMDLLTARAAGINPCLFTRRKAVLAPPAARQAKLDGAQWCSQQRSG